MGSLSACDTQSTVLYGMLDWFRRFGAFRDDEAESFGVLFTLGSNEARVDHQKQSSRAETDKGKKKVHG